MMLELKMSRSRIREQLHRQLGSFFFLNEEELADIEGSLDTALERCEKSFSRNCNKYYRSSEGITCFDPLHGCHWTAFLYFLSNSIWHKAKGSVSDKVYALNKALSSADLFYQIELPDIFAFDHPMGSVLGRASYSNYFSFSQGCTVGNNKGIYPRFGESVFMLSDSKVLGNCVIGDNVIISAGTYIKDTDIPSGSLVFGQSPNLVIKANKLEFVREYAEQVFRYE